MKNYKITFTYDGYRFWDVVAAETAEQAIEYFMWIDRENHNCTACETEEAPTHTVPAGWTKPEVKIEPMTEEESAEWDAYGDWQMKRANELDCDPEDVEDFDTWKANFR